MYTLALSALSAGPPVIAQLKQQSVNQCTGVVVVRLLWDPHNAARSVVRTLGRLNALVHMYGMQRWHCGTVC